MIQLNSFKIWFYLLLFFFVSLTHATESSTDVRLTTGTQKTQRCYGESQPSQQDSSTVYRLGDWWRCDGVKVGDEARQCPGGYVSVGIWTWPYTSSEGWVSRCQTLCAQITTVSPSSNCRWE